MTPRSEPHDTHREWRHPPHQQPKEYIITEDELESLYAMTHIKYEQQVTEIHQHVHTRPHPAPAAHCLCVECSYSARNAKSCRHTLAGEDKRKIAKAAREGVLNEITSKVEREEMFLGITIDNQEVYYLTGQHIRKIIESLRSTQQQAGERDECR